MSFVYTNTQLLTNAHTHTLSLSSCDQMFSFTHQASTAGCDIVARGNEPRTFRAPTSQHLRETASVLARRQRDSHIARSGIPNPRCSRLPSTHSAHREHEHQAVRCKQAAPTIQCGMFAKRCRNHTEEHQKQTSLKTDSEVVFGGTDWLKVTSPPLPLQRI